MTFRRVMLVLLPLLAVGLVFSVMWYLYRDWERSLVSRPRPDVRDAGRLPTGKVEMETVGKVGHEVSTDVNLLRKDRHGRKELRFLADRIEHFEKKTADIQRPRIQFFTREGETITLLAERGHVQTRGALMDADDIEAGRLWGNVVLVHDRGTRDDYADDILVGLDEVTFDNERHEIASDGPVLMAGPEMTLSASKMRMHLDPATRRLTKMEFLEDILITFEGDDRMRVSLTAPAPAAPAEAESAPDAAASPAPPSPEETGDNAPGTAADDGEGTDLWKIDLHGDVDARQGAQHLECERLTLYNRSRGPMLGGTDAGDAPAAAAEAGAAANEGPDRPSEEAPSEGPEDLGPLMTVVADGPLAIEPIDAASRRDLGEEQYVVSARGEPAVVEDGDTTIRGDLVRYHTQTGSGTVVGETAPMQLKQPGQILLTGPQLDFNRSAATARVTGAGRLEASVEGAGLMGMTAAAGEPAGEAAGADTAGASAEATRTADDGAETGTLHATWQDGLGLVFYSLPEDTEQGLGEIQQARFRGDADIKQGEVRLKGDDLAIDFFPAEAEQGQAPRRLVGKGNVFLKNAAVGGAGTGEPAQAGDIAAENLDIQFARDPEAGARPTQLDASGNVAINDPKGKIRGQELTVTFGVSDEGDTEPRFLDARGNVLIDRDDLHAEGDHVRRDEAKGTLLLEGRPARARRGESRIVGPTIRFNREDGRATVVGAGELEVPATTDLRGRPRATPEPLLVTWSRDMHFADERNFARFDGDVTARTGGTNLACRRLWVHFADAPEAAEEPAAESQEAADEGIQNLFGSKRLVRVLAEKDVTAVDQRLDEGEVIRHRMEITGDNLTYLEENRKAYMHGPGRLRILAREDADDAAARVRPITPDAADGAWRSEVPDGYARTGVTWTDSMAYDGVGSQAYFQGGVVAIHTGRGVPGEQGSSRREPTDTRITSHDLQIVFGERPGPSGTVETGTPREERMRVEKLIARGDVLLWIDDRRGSGERLIYQREPELVRLYRGPEPNEWARLWRENEATQEFGQIAARTITYNPNTGRVDVVDQQVITISPEPDRQPTPPPRLVPGPLD